MISCKIPAPHNPELPTFLPNSPGVGCWCSPVTNPATPNLFHNSGVPLGQQKRLSHSTIGAKSRAQSTEPKSNNNFLLSTGPWMPTQCLAPNSTALHATPDCQKLSTGRLTSCRYTRLWLPLQFQCRVWLPVVQRKAHRRRACLTRPTQYTRGVSFSNSNTAPDVGACRASIAPLTATLRLGRTARQHPPGFPCWV